MAEAENAGGAAAPNPAEAAAAAAAALDAPTKSRKPVVIGVAVALVLVLIGGGAWWYTGTQAQKRAQEEADANSVEKRLMKQLQTRKENRPPIFIAMDEFLVNLPGRGGEHYLQTKLVLRTGSSDTEGRIKQFLPLVRDRVITVLSSRSVDQLATVEGKNALAKETALVINAIIEPQLTAIFVLQQEMSTADMRNLERLGAIPKESSGSVTWSAAAKEAAAQFWKVSEMDLPVQAVLFNTFVMQ
jgi:flagellar FliL protein